MLPSMGSQRVGHDLVTKQQHTDAHVYAHMCIYMSNLIMVYSFKYVQLIVCHLYIRKVVLNKINSFRIIETLLLSLEYALLCYLHEGWMLAMNYIS